MKDNRFKTELLDYASKLDALTDSNGEITKNATSIVEDMDNASTVYLANLTSNMIKSADYSKEVRQLASSLRDSILKFYGFVHLTKSNVPVREDDDTRTLPELLEELNQ